MSRNQGKSIAEHVTGMAVALGLILLGILLLLMAYSAGLEDGYGEPEPGAGFFGYRRDFVVLSVIGAALTIGGLIFWLRHRRGAKG